MKKLILSAIIAMSFTGCATWGVVENMWDSGKEVGDKVLPESTKMIAKPIVKVTEKAYNKVKNKYSKESE